MTRESVAWKLALACLTRAPQGNPRRWGDDVLEAEGAACARAVDHRRRCNGVHADVELVARTYSDASAGRKPTGASAM